MLVWTFRFLACLMMVSFISSRAMGEEAGTVEKRVILYSLVDCCAFGWGEAEQEFEREMRSLGIAYLRVNGTLQESGIAFSVLEKFKDDDQNVAALFFYQRAEGKRAGVHIALFDRTENGTEVTQHSVEMALHKGAGAVVTLKAVEAVHAAFFEKPMSRIPSENIEVKAPSKTEETKMPVKPLPTKSDDKEQGAIKEKREGGRMLFSVGGEMAVVGGPGGAPPMLGVNLDAAVTPWKYLSLELSAFFSLKSWAFSMGAVSSEKDGKSTSALFGFIFVRGTILWNILHDGRFRPQFGAYGGIAFVRVEAEKPDSVVENVEGKVAILGGELRIAIEILPLLSLVVGGRLGAFVPQVRARTVRTTYVENGDTPPEVSRSTKASMGRPLGEGSLGFKLRF